MAAIVNACLLYELNAATVATQDNKIVLRILIYTIFAIKYDEKNYFVEQKYFYSFFKLTRQKISRDEISIERGAVVL